MSFLEEIQQKSRVAFRPSKGEIQVLQALGVPEDALKFYSGSVPSRMAEIGKARLCTVNDMAIENRDAVPGCYTHPAGYTVFGTTNCGDSFCFDRGSTNYPASSAIVLIAHDLEPPNDEMPRDELSKLAKQVAVSFEDFLQRFVAATLDTEPLYPPFDFGGASPRT